MKCQIEIKMKNEMWKWKTKIYKNHPHILSYILMIISIQFIRTNHKTTFQNQIANTRSKTYSFLRVPKPHQLPRVLLSIILPHVHFTSAECIIIHVYIIWFFVFTFHFAFWFQSDISFHNPTHQDKD